MLIQKECLPLLIVASLSFIMLNGCKNKGQESPENYALDKPERHELGKALNEISGIYFNAEDSSLFAIADSKEKIFRIDLRTKKLKDFTDKIVNSDSDLEDIVKVDTSIFLLMSKGVLIEVPETIKDSGHVKRYELGISGSNDFEAVYFDPTAQGLILLCKTCAQEKGTGVRTAFRFDLRSRTFDSSSFFTISRAEIKSRLKNTDANFEPSAAAIHPVSKRLFILSSAGKLLVITNTRGQVFDAFNLNPDTFPQAEGISFAPNGDMYISNEGKFGKPALLRFPYNIQNVKKK